MKKLVFAMGCFAAILLNSSCTADSPVETKNENLTTPAKDFVPRIDTSADDNDDTNPPRPPQTVESDSYAPDVSTYDDSNPPRPPQS